MTFSFLKAFLGCQIYAPLMMAGVPDFPKMKVLSVRTIEGDGKAPLHNGQWGNLVFDLPRKRTIIEYTINGEYGGWLVYDHDSKEVDSNDGGLLHAPYHGSGGIGVLIFGLPGLIATFPLTFLTSLVFDAIEFKTGMNRWAWAVFRAIENQLEPELREELRIAFQRVPA